LDAATEQRLNARHASMDELLAQADFVVLQVPYSQATHHLIGATELAKMKRSAILVNAARGGVVDDAALIEALKNGTIAAAGLDVFENEPKLDPGFLALKNVVLAPHVGSSTRVTRLAMAMTAARNLVAALTGGTPPNLVNPR
ncbi:MAG: D-glycerate dehydrogenase, partial [Burkholderiales bacterium]|nr:D-glycerate dehydrogenase [Burkholderiales bacterium]